MEVYRRQHNIAFAGRTLCGHGGADLLKDRHNLRRIGIVELHDAQIVSHRIGGVEFACHLRGPLYGLGISAQNDGIAGF